MSVIEEIKAERERQIQQEGWSPTHDDGHSDHDLAYAAVAYIVDRVNAPNFWPWEWSSFKPKDRRRDLLRAAALLVAEIERIDRVSSRN